MSDAKQVDKFKSALHNNGYLCTDTFSNEVYCALKKKPMSITMLIGQAGTGKSFLPETLGKVLGCNVYVKQAYQGNLYVSTFQMKMQKVVLNLLMQKYYVQ